MEENDEYDDVVRNRRLGHNHRSDHLQREGVGSCIKSSKSVMQNHLTTQNLSVKMREIDC